MYFGYFIVILGILSLLNVMGLISGGFWSYVWPILLIVLGLAILTNKKENSCCCWPWHKHHQGHYHGDKPEPPKPGDHPHQGQM